MKGYVLRYLATVAGGGTLAQARLSVPGVLAGIVRGRAQKLAIAAGFETERADDAAHVHRLAYLRAISVAANDVNDVDAVRALYESSRRPAAERRALLGIAVPLLGALAIGGAGAGAWWLWSSSAAPAASTVTTSAAAPLAEPEEEHPLTPLFAETLPRYVIALDAASAQRDADLDGARAEVLRTLERESAMLVPTMTGLLDASERYIAPQPEDTDSAGNWLNQLVLFHDALEREEVPFFVDAQLRYDYRNGRQRVLMSSYRVRGRRTFQVGELRIRGLDIERIDSLNFRDSLLGYTRPELRYALVMVDRIERMLIEDLLPSIHAADESVIVRDYHDETGTEWVTEFEGWAHQDLRQESGRLVAAELRDQRGLNALASAIVQRRNAIIAVNQSLRSSGVAFREPLAYEYELERLSRFAGVDPMARDNVHGAQASLRSEPVLAAYRVLHGAISDSIAEHEVQHRLDYEAGRLMTVPEALSRYTGETESEDRVNRRAERANAELSAYLSQVAQRPSLARTSLIHIASFMMNRHSWSMPEAYAAVALYESLATEAGIEHTPLISQRRIVRSEVARIYGELRTREPDEISALAARTWTRLYGAELPTIREQR
jgi:hypothetical protein